MGRYICPRSFDTLNKEERRRWVPRRQQRWDRRLVLPWCEMAAPLRGRFQQLVVRWAFSKDELVYVNDPYEEMLRWIVWLHAMKLRRWRWKHSSPRKQLKVEEAAKAARLVFLLFSSTLAGRSKEPAMVLEGHILRCRPAFSLACWLASSTGTDWRHGGAAQTDRRGRYMCYRYLTIMRLVTQNRNIAYVGLLVLV